MNEIINYIYLIYIQLTKSKYQWSGNFVNDL